MSCSACGVHNRSPGPQRGHAPRWPWPRVLAIDSPSFCGRAVRGGTRSPLRPRWLIADLGPVLQDTSSSRTHREAIYLATGGGDDHRLGYIKRSNARAAARAARPPPRSSRLKRELVSLVRKSRPSPPCRDQGPAWMISCTLVRSVTSPTVRL